MSNITSELDSLNALLSPMSLEERLAWATHAHPGTAAFSSSFGQEDQVIADVIAREKLGIRIFTLDTGRLFAETYAVAEGTRAQYGAEIETYFPDTERVQDLVTRKGFFSFYDSLENRKECCHIRKIEPLQRALAGTTLWVTGLRAEQSTNRQEMRLLEWDDGYKLFKINPLIDWTYAQVTAHLTTHRVPENVLHQQGFISIGCAPCTRAIQPGENPRAGRWWWEESKKECGLHARAQATPTTEAT